jgi:hypothetical protein
MVWVGDNKKVSGLSVGMMLGFTIGRLYNIMDALSDDYCRVMDDDEDMRYVHRKWFISIKEYRRRKLLKISGRRL